MNIFVTYISFLFITCPAFSIGETTLYQVWAWCTRPWYGREGCDSGVWWFLLANCLCTKFWWWSKKIGNSLFFSFHSGIHHLRLKSKIHDHILPCRLTGSQSGIHALVTTWKYASFLFRLLFYRVFLCFYPFFCHVFYRKKTKSFLVPLFHFFDTVDCFSS